MKHSHDEPMDARSAPAWMIALRWFGNEVAGFILKLSLALGTLVAVLWCGLLLFRSAAGPIDASSANRPTEYERKIAGRPTIECAREIVEESGVDVRLTPRDTVDEAMTPADRREAFRRFVTSRGRGTVTSERTSARF